MNTDERDSFNKYAERFKARRFLEKISADDEIPEEPTPLEKLITAIALVILLFMSFLLAFGYGRLSMFLIDKF